MKQGEIVFEVREAVEVGDNVKREVDATDTVLSRSTVANPQPYGAKAPTTRLMRPV